MIEEDRRRLSPEVQDGAQSGIAVEAGNVEASTRFALVIDDQESVCRAFGTILASLGVEYAAYVTAKPAISSLDQRRPDAIFLDIALDQSDAIDVIKGLSEKHYNGIVQLMSGGRLPLLEAIQRIGTRYGLVLRPALQKPFRGDDLHQAILNAGLGRVLGPQTLKRSATI
jgi:DNA-binding NtrC family response regulator